MFFFRSLCILMESANSTSRKTPHEINKRDVSGTKRCTSVFAVLGSQNLLFVFCLEQRYINRTWHSEIYLRECFTHPQVCTSTLLCHFRDRRTPACSQRCREASARCRRFCTTFRLRGNGLQFKQHLDFLLFETPVVVTLFSKIKQEYNEEKIAQGTKNSDFNEQII